MTEKLSLKGYARRRGCSPAAVRKAIKRLDIPQDPDGMVYVAEADRLWPLDQAPLGGTAGGTEAEGRLPPGEPTYAEARRRRELAKAQREELALAEAQGSLIPLDYMDQQLGACLARVRQVLLSMPGKWAPQIVGVPTVARAQMILQEAIDEAMPTLQTIGADPSLDSEDP